MEFLDSFTPKDIIEKFGYKKEEIEAVFINRRIKSKDTILKDGDRVTLLPPRIPGSYRLILDINKAKEEEGN